MVLGGRAFVVQDVPKLLSEVSLADVYLDFRAALPDVNIRERAFRYLRPQELRRMKMRHLEMCGCRSLALASCALCTACCICSYYATVESAHCCRPDATGRWCVEMNLLQGALNRARATSSLGATGRRAMHRPLRT
jgi:hypothetical protein